MNETPPAGWYPDPQDASRQRYWDGKVWTEHTAPAAQQAAPLSSGSSAPDPWLWQSIVATVLCCLPAGVVGIAFAVKSQSAASVGDLTGAQQAADTARTWTLVSVGLGLAVGVLLVFFFILGGLASY